MWRVTAICGLFLVLSASCGHRTPITADDDDDKKEDRDERACGHGLPCDPDNLGGRTCESLGLTEGTLSCDPKTCNLVLTKCGPRMSATGNGGGGADGSPDTMTPGLFGGVGGAPPAMGTGGTGTGFFGAGFFGADGGFFGGGMQPNDNGDDDGGTESND